MDKSSYYTVAHPNEFAINWREFYDKVDRLTAETRLRLDHRLDISYGASADPKRKLDLYLPETASGHSPVFIFIHGGGFREGDREDYGFVAMPFSKRDVITVVPSYRWAPQYRYPAQVEDVLDILSWVYHNITSVGGDVDKIYLGGHSAGAILSATVSVNSKWVKQRRFAKNLIKGCIPVSGRYDLRNSPSTDVYVSDQSLLVQASPILNVVDPPTRTLVAVGSKEETVLRPSQEFVEKITERGGSAKLLILEGMNHADTALTLGSEGKLSREIISMIESDLH